MGALDSWLILLYMWLIRVYLYLVIRWLIQVDAPTNSKAGEKTISFTSYIQKVTTIYSANNMLPRTEKQKAGYNQKREKRGKQSIGAIYLGLVPRPPMMVQHNRRDRDHHPVKLD